MGLVPVAEAPALYTYGNAIEPMNAFIYIEINEVYYGIYYNKVIYYAYMHPDKLPLSLLTVTTPRR